MTEHGDEPKQQAHKTHRECDFLDKPLPARDLGAGGFEVFRRVILPMSLPGVAAGMLLVTLPMMGDYFTSDLLSGEPSTTMIGNLINIETAPAASIVSTGTVTLSKAIKIKVGGTNYYIPIGSTIA